VDQVVRVVRTFVGGKETFRVGYFVLNFADLESVVVLIS